MRVKVAIFKVYIPLGYLSANHAEYALQIYRYVSIATQSLYSDLGSHVCTRCLEVSSKWPFDMEMMNDGPSMGQLLSLHRLSCAKQILFVLCLYVCPLTKLLTSN